MDWGVIQFLSKTGTDFIDFYINIMNPHNNTIK